MKLARLKLITFISLITAFIISVTVVYIYYKSNLIDFETDEAPNEFMLILKKVIGIYSVHISVAIASYFTSNYTSNSKMAVEKHYVAFSLILIWILGFVLYILINGINLPKGDIGFNDLFQDLDTITTTFNFLITGAIVFLFVETPKAKSAVKRSGASREAGH